MGAFTFQVIGRVVEADLCGAIEAKAMSLGLTGWVKNEFDTVAGTVQGSEGPLDAFHEWLSAGIPGARIDVVDWVSAEPRQDRTTFHRMWTARRD
jgi:acylphosphatase